MTNCKSTKRALLMSALVIVMCFSMLIGTTFAWFTDSASTNVNRIQAGTLDIALEVSYDNGTTWSDANGTTLDFVKKAGHENEPILWEPGCTYSLPLLRVANNGTLHLKYKILLTGIQGDAKLNEAINWTINGIDMSREIKLAPGEKTPITITGQMKTDAGNEYQGLSIEDIAITVVATQDTVENDGNGSDYDQNATYPTYIADGVQVNGEGVYEISNANGMFWLAQQVNVKHNNFEGKTVKLMDNINLDNRTWTPIGQTGGTEFYGMFDGNGKTINNLNIDEANLADVSEATGIGLFGWITHTNGGVKNLTIDGATISGHHYVGAVVGNLQFGTVSDCTVKNVQINAGHKDAERCGDKVGGVIGMVSPNVQAVVDQCHAENVSIVAGRDAGQVIGCRYSVSPITNCTATNVTVTADGNENCTGANIRNDIWGRQPS